jgi:hypothetical protein
MKHRLWLAAVMAAATVADAGAQTFSFSHGEGPGEPFVMHPAMVEAQTIVVESKVTTGRPYSADATTEFVQVLADGNRISHATTTRIFRDSEGRTRREELAADDTARSISIYDPVAHVTYVLDPRTRTASKMPVSIMYPADFTVAKSARPAREGVGETFTVVVSEGAGERGVVTGAAKANVAEVSSFKAEGSGGFGFVTSARMKVPMGNATTESLGQQMIAGVPAIGTRTTTVIPAGKIGNQQEIRIVSEQWFSEDLHVLVMTRHSDPRSGETTYRLSNISRAEPGAALFELPADYTVRDRAKMHEQ